MDFFKKYKIKIIFTILIVFLFSEFNILIFAASPVSSNSSESQFVFKEENGVSSLDGKWEFYWEELLEPADFSAGDKIVRYVDIPGDLSKQEYESGKYPSDTFGTFRTKVLVDDIDKNYGLKASYFSSANKIWVNGKLLFSSGIVADNKNDFSPQYMPAEIYFPTDSEEVEIVIQVANFHHRRIRLKEVMFGEAAAIKQLTYRNLIKESTLAGGLFLIAIYYAVLYRIHQRDKSAIYLSLLSLAVAVRGIIIEEKILLRIFPDISGELLMKLGFLPSFLFLPLIALYIREVFKVTEINKMTDWLKKFAYFSIIFIALTPGKVYDLAFKIMDCFFVPIGIYIVYVMIANKDYRKMRGYNLMVTGTVILLLSAVNDILAEFDVINSVEIFSFGMFLFIVIQAIFLAWEFNEPFIRVKNLAEENETMLVEIHELNKSLEEKIKKRTSELEELNRKLQGYSNSDPLTGLNNRRSFEKRLDKEWNKITNDKRPLSALMFDVDFFKEYNDYYGHLYGDDCLIKIADEIKKSVKRSGDFAARYGGEEFIVLLPDTDLEASATIAEQIRQNIEKMKIPHESSDISDFVTVSVGVHTVWPDQEIDKWELIDHADKYLYLAKKMGRNRIAKGHGKDVNECAGQLELDFLK